MPVEIKLEDNVAIVTLDEGENRLNLDFLTKFLERLIMWKSTRMLTCWWCAVRTRRFSVTE